MDYTMEDENYDIDLGTPISPPSPTVSDYAVPTRERHVYQSRSAREHAAEHRKPTVSLIRTKDYSNVNKIAEQDHLTDENWHEWKERMRRVFINCRIIGYVNGETLRPNVLDDPKGASNWDMNDCWAQQVIIHNVTSSQMNHVGSKETAEAMYSALKDTHENTAHQTVNQIENQLYETKLVEGEDMLKHLDNLKSLRDRINKFPNTEFHVYDTRFKSIISNSLPSSWLTFVEPYNGNANNPNDPDPKKSLSADAFIGLLREEFKIRVKRAGNGTTNGMTGSTNMVQHANNSKSLSARIGNHKAKSSHPYCDDCWKPGHWTSKCRNNPRNKCYNCGKYGHHARNCRAPRKKMGKEKRGDKKEKVNQENGDESN